MEENKEFETEPLEFHERLDGDDSESPGDEDASSADSLNAAMGEEEIEAVSADLADEPTDQSLPQFGERLETKSHTETEGMDSDPNPDNSFDTDEM